MQEGKAESSSYETIRLTVEAPIARLVLARPPLNILNIDMLEEIADALDTLAPRRDLRAVVIGAQGRVFSAGVDERSTERRRSTCPSSLRPRMRARGSRHSARSERRAGATPEGGSVRAEA